MRDKIAKINYECCTGLPWESADEHEQRGAYKHTDEILALFNQCPASDIEDCPWGKENVEFRKILLKFLPSLDGIVVEEECSHCENGYITYNPNLNPDAWHGVASAKCKHCHGTGIITRPVEWKEVIEWVTDTLKSAERVAVEVGVMNKGGRLRVEE